MSLIKKIAGVATGVSAVAILGVAIAQGQPPNPLITNHALGAGQQSTHVTPMGETGVLAPLDELRTAAVITEERIAVVPEPQPEVAAATAEPAPEPVAAAPAPAPEPVAIAPPEPTTTTMGAGPAEPEQPMRAARADRN